MLGVELENVGWCTGSGGILEAVDPGSVNFFSTSGELGELPYMVFQLKRPSYEILRRWGSLVKSTSLVIFSRPTKNSSKLGVSADNVANRSPLGVK